MKTETTNSRRVDILGNSSKPDQEIFSSVQKRWQQRFGYWPVLAAVPAVLASQLHLTRPVDARQQETKVTGLNTRSPRGLNLSSSSRSLLKRQSEFRLPHQSGNEDGLAALGGFDDCPGRAIPAGNYTAASPFVDSGDTTGANNTIDTVYLYCYYSTLNVPGADHAYSFTLSAIGANPQIQISTSAGTFQPVAYVLPSETPCPGGITNQNVFLFCDWSGATGTINMSRLPLNTRLYLFIDSLTDEPGPYTIRMQDVTITQDATCSHANSIDCVEPFVQQQYLDFLSRTPDTIGFQNWVNTLSNCPNGGFGEFDSPQCDRVHVSAGFVQSNEFQGRGYWILRFGYVGLNRSIGSVRSSANYSEFTSALAQVGGSNSPAEEEAAKVAYANAFVQRPDFRALFPITMTASEYVNALETNAQVTLINKQALIDALNAGTMSRAAVLRNVVESQPVFDRYIIPAFVTMEYFGYLRRDPDVIGYQNWVNTLASNPSDYRHMIFGFIYSTEYRSRFGTP